MSTPNEKLAESLAVLRALQKDGRRVFKSDDLSRTHRERLLQNGFLQDVMKGWLISSSPSARAGDSTPWYASFWEFCARYCNDRFQEQWHLSPEQSLLLHAENTVIPTQAVVYSPKGTNHTIELLFGTSLYDLKQVEMPTGADISVRNGLRLFCVQLWFNLLWAWIFFDRHQIGIALLDLIVLWIAIALTVRSFRIVSHTAAWLMVPYLVWVAFAIYLNFGIWRLN